ncbi:MAG: hypothetical protein JRI36_03750 [Deltaproteobacteria bacterium]|nr:hypothetical protein [Deltaproteobacteria bacterium]
MQEEILRKWHRRIGIVVALFIILQAGSGLWITLGESFESETHGHGDELAPTALHQPEESTGHEIMGTVHHRGGVGGLIYRIVTGAAVIGMALSGAGIFLKTNRRMRRR